jgi:hypothetical protein
MESTRTLGASAAQPDSGCRPQQEHAPGDSDTPRGHCQWQPRPVRISFKFKLRSKVDYLQVVAVGFPLAGPSGTLKFIPDSRSVPPRFGRENSRDSDFPDPDSAGIGKISGIPAPIPDVQWPGIGKSSVLGVVHSHGDRILASDLRRIAGFP